MSQLINTYQAAVLLDYHPQTVRNLANKKIIPGIKRRQKWFFEAEKLKQWLIGEENKSNTNVEPPQIADL